MDFTDRALMLLVFVVLLCGLLAVLAWASDRYVEKTRNRLLPPSERCFRAGSVESYWRERGELERHRRRWVA